MTTLLKNGLVLADFSPAATPIAADISIEGSRIRAVGASLDAPPGADVVDLAGHLVIPGLVNAHVHAWQGFLRGEAIDQSLGEYFGRMLAGFGAHMTPEDVALGIRITTLESLDAGVTTMLDYCHVLNSPRHVEAAVEAHRHAGMRTVFAYGPPATDQPGWWYGSTRPHPREAIEVRKRLLSSDDGRMTMALALRGPDATDALTTEADFALARELDVVATLHIGFGPKSTLGDLAARGLLGPKVNVVHACNASFEELSAAAGAGATIAVTPEVEMQMGMGKPAFASALRAGLVTSLGTDVPSAATSDLFSAARFTLQAARGLLHLETLARGEAVSRVPLSARDVFQAATAGGASALGLAARTGRIAPGLEADIVAIRTDALHMEPLGATASALLHARPSDVAWVFVGGEVKKRAGTLVAEDRAALLAEAERRRRSLRVRVKGSHP